MTIWILALLLLAGAAGLGYAQGAIRAAFSFLGIVFAALLAVPIGSIFKPLLPHVGIESPTMIWAIAPIEGFVIVLILFKVGAHFVHRKVDLYYRYKAGDLRFALWERLNHRVGLSIGVLNGAAYFVLICFVIFNFSYWTVQVASSDQETGTTRFINKMGKDLQSTGMSKAANAVATLPNDYYRVANLAGLISQNPQLSDRLGDYPAFISLGERDDLQQLANDSTFTNAWASHAPMGEIMNIPSVQNLLKNGDLLKTVWGILQTNMDDLTTYLHTGKSPKFDSEKILGHWDFNSNVSAAMVRQARPNITAKEMRAVRIWMNQAYENTTFTAAGDNQIYLKNLPQIKVEKGQAPTTEKNNWHGEWSGSETNYDVTLKSDSGATRTMAATTDGVRLTLKDSQDTFVFDHE